MSTPRHRSRDLTSEASLEAVQAMILVGHEQKPSQSGPARPLRGARWCLGHPCWDVKSPSRRSVRCPRPGDRPQRRRC